MTKYNFPTINLKSYKEKRKNKMKFFYQIFIYNKGKLERNSN